MRKHLIIQFLSLLTLFSPVFTCAQKEKADIPPLRMYHSMAYHHGLDKIFLFGGHSKHGWFDDLRDVWSYDMGKYKWQKVGIFEASPDSIGEAQSAIYDIESNVVIVFNTLGETWCYKAEINKWKNMKPSSAPSPRCGHMTSYDTQSDRIVLFGGFGCKSVNDSVFSDTWIYNYDDNTWTRMNPNNSPQARCYGSMIFNTNLNKTILWGGRQIEPITDNSIWEYNLEEDNWRKIKSNSGPKTSYAYPTLIYDDQKNEMVLFGGGILESPFAGKQLNEIWKYNFDGHEWKAVKSNNAPPPVTIHSMVFHPKHRKALLFGGEIKEMYSNNMLKGSWIYNLDDNIWIKH